MLFRLRNSLSPTGDSLVPKRVRTMWLASSHSHAFLIHLWELSTMRSSGRPIRFLRIVTSTNRGKNCQCPCINISINIEVNHFIRQKQAFNSTRIYRRHGTMSPEKISKLTRSWLLIWKVPVPLYRKVTPVLEFLFPAKRSTLLAIAVEWKLVFV